MPQLDKFTFFPVVSWVLVIVFILYNLLLVSGLPKLYKILSYRKKVLEYNSNIRDILAGEYFYITKMHYKVFFEFLNGIKIGPEKSIISVENGFDVLKEFSIKNEAFQKEWVAQNVICLPSLSKVDLNDN